MSFGGWPGPPCCEVPPWELLFPPLGLSLASQRKLSPKINGAQLSTCGLFAGWWKGRDVEEGEKERWRRDKQTDPLDSNESISDNVGSDLGLTGTSLSDILPSETGI